MWIVSALCLLTNHVFFSLSGAPFLLAYDLPTSLLPPKLLIKTNLAPWEIKPTFAEQWHQLQVSHCAFCLSYSTTPRFVSHSHFASHSLYHSLKLPTLLELFFSAWPPPAPHCRWMCSCKKEASTIWLLCTLGTYMGWCMILTRKFNSVAFSVFTKRSSLSSDFHLSQRAICQLGHERSRPSHSTSSPSGIIWESINLIKEWTVTRFNVM